jgi:hypothetical protein
LPCTPLWLIVFPLAVAALPPVPSEDDDWVGVVDLAPNPSEDADVSPAAALPPVPTVPLLLPGVTEPAPLPTVEAEAGPPAAPAPLPCACPSVATPKASIKAIGIKETLLIVIACSQRFSPSKENNGDPAPFL